MALLKLAARDSGSLDDRVQRADLDLTMLRDSHNPRAAVNNAPQMEVTPTLAQIGEAVTPQNTRHLSP